MRSSLQEGAKAFCQVLSSWQEGVPPPSQSFAALPGNIVILRASGVARAGPSHLCTPAARGDEEQLTR